MKSKIISHRKYTEVTFSGEANMAAFSGLFDNPQSCKSCQPGSPFLIDIKLLDTSTLKVNDMTNLKHICIKMKSMLAHTRFAILVSRNLEYGMARMWMTLIGEELDTTISVFRSKEKAMSWLIESKETPSKISLMHGAAYAASFIGAT